MTPALVDAIFMAHAGLEQERAQLTSCAARSQSGGTKTAAAKAQAAAGKCLRKAYRSKAQRRGMLVSAMQEAAQFKDVRWRGAGSVAQLIRDKASNMTAVAEASVASRHHALTTSCNTTATGLPRAALPPVAAVAYKAPAPCSDPKQPGGGGGRGAAAIASRKRKHTEEVQRRCALSAHSQQPQ